MKYIIIIFICLTSSLVIAQEKRRGFYNITEAGYMPGVGTFKVNGQKIPNDGRAYRLRTQFGTFINPKLSVGLGIGLDGYHDPGFNTCPAFADVHYYISKNKPWFLFMDLGYAIPLYLSFEKGVMYNLGVGWRKKSLIYSFGYNIQQMKENNITLKTISICLGILF